MTVETEGRSMPRPHARADSRNVTARLPSPLKRATAAWRSAAGTPASTRSHAHVPHLAVAHSCAHAQHPPSAL